MFGKTFIILIAFSFGNGIPLESSSDDMAKFFSSSNRIVGGTEAPEGYAPHMAALVMGEHYIGLVCGGSIVSSKLIMTAAHCIDAFVFMGKLPESFRGIVGSNYYNSPSNAVYFSDYRVHPKWDWVTIKNDIGFLVMEKHLPSSSRVKPIALNLNRINHEEHCYVTGWGMLGTWPVDIIPDALQLLYVKTISHEECLDGIRAASIPGGFVHPLDFDIEICTFHSPGHGMCMGDSGSALVSTKSKRQIGIVSWGFACAIGAPDVFCRLSGFKKYILDTMKEIN